MPVPLIIASLLSMCTHHMRVHMCNAASTTAVWMDYDLGEPYTYDKAVKFCKQHGVGVCWRDQYCTGGKGGQLLSGAGSMSSGDNWAPVADNYNSWIQTGDGGQWGHDQCWTHTELGFGRPKWGTSGLSAGSGGSGRRLCCARTTPKPTGELNIIRHSFRGPLR